MPLPIRPPPLRKPCRESRERWGRNRQLKGLYDLAASLGAPTSLAALGLKAADLDRAADIAVQNPYYNPRPITREGIRALLQDAFEGRRPRTGYVISLPPDQRERYHWYYRQ